MPSTYERHLQAIESGHVTATTVIGLRKALNAMERNWRGGRKQSSLTAVQLDVLCSRLAAVRPVVDAALHESGLKRLRDPRYRKRWTQRQQDAIDNIARFRLIGFWWIGRNVTPLYRAETEEGAGFDFYCQSWQSGGDGPEIVT